MMSFISQVLQSTVQEAKQLKQKYVILYRMMCTAQYASLMFVCRLCESELEHSAALSGAVTALRHDEEARLSSKVENMREQEKVYYLMSCSLFSIE